MSTLVGKSVRVSHLLTRSSVHDTTSDAPSRGRAARTRAAMFRKFFGKGKNRRGKRAPGGRDPRGRRESSTAAPSDDADDDDVSATNAAADDDDDRRPRPPAPDDATLLSLFLAAGSDRRAFRRACASLVDALTTRPRAVPSHAAPLLRDALAREMNNDGDGGDDDDDDGGVGGARSRRVAIDLVAALALHEENHALVLSVLGALDDAFERAFEDEELYADAKASKASNANKSSSGKKRGSSSSSASKKKKKKKDATTTLPSPLHARVLQALLRVLGDAFTATDVLEMTRASVAAALVVVVDALDAASGASLRLLPIRPRRRGARRSLRRTFSPSAYLRAPLGFDPDTPRRLSTLPDAYELHPDVRSCGPSTLSRIRMPGRVVPSSARGAADARAHDSGRALRERGEGRGHPDARDALQEAVRGAREDDAGDRSDPSRVRRARSGVGVVDARRSR